MASRYWVGGTGTWDTTTTTHWSATSGGAGGATAPTSADDVFLDAASGAAVITIASGVTVPTRNLTCTGFTGTLTGPGSLAISGGLVLASTMTFTLSGSVNLSATTTNGGIGWPVTTAGRTLPAVTAGGTGGRWQLQDDLVCSGNLTLQKGTLDTNSKNVQCLSFASSGTLTRGMVLGSSTITCTSTGSAWNHPSATGLTVAANTATALLTGAGASFVSTPMDWLGLSVTMTGSGITKFTHTSPVTIQNFTRTAPSARQAGVSFAGDTIINGTLTATTASPADRMVIESSTLRAQRTLTTPNPPVLANVDFLDIVTAGAATPWTGTLLGDAATDVGNSGITFPTAVDCYWVGGTGSWSNPAHWASTSGGVGGTSRIPLVQDNAHFDGNSGGGTCTVDQPWLCADLICTGYTGTFSLATSVAVWGDVILTAAMGLTSNNFGWVLVGRYLDHVLFTDTKVLYNLTLYSGGYTLTSSLTLTSGQAFVHAGGTFDSNGYAVTVGSYNGNFSTPTATRALYMRSSVWTLNATSAAWSLGGTLLTFDAGTSTIQYTSGSVNTRTFAGGGLTYNILDLSGAPGLASWGAWLITGNNTFAVLRATAGHLIQFAAGSTQTVGTWDVNGAPNPIGLRLPAVAPFGAVFPDSAALSVTGDLDVRVLAQAIDWTPAAAMVLAAKEQTTTQRSYRLIIAAGGAIQAGVAGDGATLTLVGGSPTGFADGTDGWVRFTWRASDGLLSLFSSLDGVTWTARGTGTRAVGSIFDSTSYLELGSRLAISNDLFAGVIKRVQIRNNVLNDGTGIVFDADLTTKRVGVDTYTEPVSGGVLTYFGTNTRLADDRVELTSGTPGTTATLVSPGASSYGLKVQDIASTSLIAYNSTNAGNDPGVRFSDVDWATAGGGSASAGGAAATVTYQAQGSGTRNRALDPSFELGSGVSSPQGTGTVARTAGIGRDGGYGVHVDAQALGAGVQGLATWATNGNYLYVNAGDPITLSAHVSGTAGTRVQIVARFGLWAGGATFVYGPPVTLSGAGYDRLSFQTTAPTDTATVSFKVVTVDGAAAFDVDDIQVETGPLSPWEDTNRGAAAATVSAGAVTQNAAAGGDVVSAGGAAASGVLAVTAGADAVSVGAAAAVALLQLAGGGASTSSAGGAAVLIGAVTAGGASSTAGSAAADRCLQATAGGASIGNGQASVLLTSTASAGGASSTAGSAAADRGLQATAGGSSGSAGAVAATVLYQATAAGSSAALGGTAGAVLFQAAASGSSASVGAAASTTDRQAAAGGSSGSAGAGAATQTYQASAGGGSVSVGATSTASGLVATAGGSSASVGAAAAALLLQVSASGVGVSAGAGAAGRLVALTAGGASSTAGAAAAALLLQASASGSGVSVGGAAGLVPAAAGGASTSAGAAALASTSGVSASGGSVSAGGAAATGQWQASAGGSSVSQASAAAGGTRLASAGGASLGGGSAPATIPALFVTAGGASASLGATFGARVAATSAGGSSGSAGGGAPTTDRLATAGGSSSSQGAAGSSTDRHATASGASTSAGGAATQLRSSASAGGASTTSGAARAARLQTASAGGQAVSYGEALGALRGKVTYLAAALVATFGRVVHLRARVG